MDKNECKICKGHGKIFTYNSHGQLVWINKEPLYKACSVCNGSGKINNK